MPIQMFRSVFVVFGEAVVACLPVTLVLGVSDPVPIAEFESAFAESPALTVLLPPFDRRAVESGFSRLQLQAAYANWTSGDESEIDAAALVEFIRARADSIWAGQTTIEWNVPDPSTSGMIDLASGFGIRAELAFVGERFLSTATSRNRRSPGVEVFLGQVVSNGVEVLMMPEMMPEQPSSGEAMLGPLTTRAVRRGRLASDHVLPSMSLTAARDTIQAGSAPLVLDSLAFVFEAAADLNRLHVLPGTFTIDGIETLVVITRLGGVRWYYLSLQHNLALVRIEIFHERFSEGGEYLGRELRSVQRFRNLINAGDGIFVSSLVEVVLRWVDRRHSDDIEEVRYTIRRGTVSRAEVNRAISDQVFFIPHVGRNRIIDDHIRGARWAFDPAGVPDVGEALLIASGRRETNTDASLANDDVDDDTPNIDRVPITEESIRGLRESMLCTVVASFLALHQLGFEVSIDQVAESIGWESGRPRSARDMEQGMSRLADVNVELRRVDRAELELLLGYDEVAVLLLLDLESDDVGHVCTIVGSQSDGSLLTVDYPELRRSISSDELSERWGGEVLVVSRSAGDLTAPVQRGRAWILLLVGSAGFLVLGLALLLAGWKSRREVVPC